MYRRLDRRIYLSMYLYGLVHTETMKIPAAKAPVDKEWCNLETASLRCLKGSRQSRCYSRAKLQYLSRAHIAMAPLVEYSTPAASQAALVRMWCMSHHQCATQRFLGPWSSPHLLLARSTTDISELLLREAADNRFVPLGAHRRLHFVYIVCGAEYELTV